MRLGQTYKHTFSYWQVTLSDKGQSEKPGYLAVRENSTWRFPPKKKIQEELTIRGDGKTNKEPLSFRFY